MQEIDLHAVFWNQMSFLTQHFVFMCAWEPSQVEQALNLCLALILKNQFAKKDFKEVKIVTRIFSLHHN